jgi:hypothetical protein
MKKLLTMVLLAGTIWSCNNHKPEKSKNFNNISEAEEHHPEATDEKLELNNGAKWKVDGITHNNVNSLKLIIKEFDKGNDKSLSAYKKTQSDLQKGIEKMIAECKMQGANHLALHKWLEPLMVQVADFKKESATPYAAEALNGIQTQVTLYDQYFEQ